MVIDTAVNGYRYDWMMVIYTGMTGGGGGGGRMRMSDQDINSGFARVVQNIQFFFLFLLFRLLKL